MYDMKSSEFWDYIAGRKFSSDMSFSYNIKCSKTRVDMLAELCAGKRILHVGCCDHLPLLQLKRERGLWLHEVLTAVGVDCLGVDIDSTAVDEVTRKTGMNNIIVGDVTCVGLDRIDQGSWDIVVFGEIIEHIGNPVSFLRDFNDCYGEKVNYIVVTVPNARSLRSIANSLLGVERINTDHRFEFTPYTLMKVLYDAGYVTKDFVITHNKSQSRIRSYLKTAVLRLLPLCGDGLVAVASRKNNN